MQPGRNPVCSHWRSMKWISNYTSPLLVVGSLEDGDWGLVLRISPTMGLSHRLDWFSRLFSSPIPFIFPSFPCPIPKVWKSLWKDEGLTLCQSCLPLYQRQLGNVSFCSRSNRSPFVIVTSEFQAHALSILINLTGKPLLAQPHSSLVI